MVIVFAGDFRMAMAILNGWNYLLGCKDFGFLSEFIELKEITLLEVLIMLECSW
jgi:hypothetical protein